MQQLTALSIKKTCDSHIIHSKFGISTMSVLSLPEQKKAGWPGLRIEDSINDSGFVMNYTRYKLYYSLSHTLLLLVLAFVLELTALKMHFFLNTYKKFSCANNLMPMSQRSGLADMLQKKKTATCFVLSSPKRFCLRLATHETIIKSKAILEMRETTDIRTISTF